MINVLNNLHSKEKKLEYLNEITENPEAFPMEWTHHTNHIRTMDVLPQIFPE